MSEDPTHDAMRIHASKGGGGLKWLLGAAAAVVLLGGGYYVWKTYAPNQDGVETAYNDPYAADPLRARPLDRDEDAPGAGVATDDGVAAAPAPTETRPAPPARRPTASATAVAEETIGVTPANATIEDSDEIVVTGVRRPVWTRMPSARRLSALYPVRALERGREGEARLSCVVQDGGALACERVEETPGGFGAAALRVARTLRHAPTRADGSDAIGSPVNLRVVFRLEDDDRRVGRG